MTRHHCPPLTADGKLSDVYRAIRDTGATGATGSDITATTGHPGRQIGPLIGTLLITGRIRTHGHRGNVAGTRWPATVYITPRAALALGPAWKGTR